MPKDEPQTRKFLWLPPDKLTFYDENGEPIETAEVPKPPPQPAD